ncbi:MAG: B12-binding domain-containing radical SAM protein [Armatimonadetes bacterium]|nr:B12-binding domain-containing radical SAM protein [Armatimonadota bacterium]
MSLSDERRRSRSRIHGGRPQSRKLAAADFAHCRRAVLREEQPLPSLRHGPGPIRVAIVYPGSYSEGMASLAVHVLLELFNAAPCEAQRAFFFPAFTKPVRTIETGAALADAHLLAATLQFELQYPTLVRMLADSGIPPLASERRAEHPVLVCGGPAVSANPAPLAAIADLVFLGELEARIADIREALATVAVSSASRDRLLAALSQVPGFLNCAEWLAGHVGQAFLQHVTDANAYVPHSVILSEAAELSGRALIEVSRGCPHACKFCLARQLYFPHRPRGLAAVVGVLNEFAGLAKTVGYIAPSFSDHPAAEELVHAALERGLTVSVSSLRADSLATRPSLLDALRLAGQQTITLAPEAATEAMRWSLAKPLPTDGLLSAVEAAGAAGFRSLKLYFMVGLPGEEDADVAAIGELIASIRAAAPALEMTVSIAPFVPKAHTALEQAPFGPMRLIERRVRLASRAASRAGARADVDSPRLAAVQAILSRGGFELGPILAGARLQQGGASALPAAMLDAGLDPENYACHGSPERPWQVITCLV